MQSGSTPKVDDYFSDLQTPNTNDMSLQLEELVQQGTLSPEQAQAILADPSAMNEIKTDPQLKKAQMDALLGLQDISGSGGMTDMDRANLAKIQTDEDTAARGKREAILQNAQARGLGGSGLELMSQMQNQQDSATRQSQRDMDVSAQAQQRALEALMQGGQMAGQMQGQDFNQQAQVAGANDAISKFNAANQQQVGMTNTAARNDAQAKNMAVKQGIADSNVQMRNQQQQHNKDLLQREFENQLKKRGGSAGLAQQNAAAAGQDSQNQANANNQNVGTALTVASMFSDERGKCEVEEFDPSEFLDKLVSKKYKYKDPKHGEGQRYGITAQDLEKSDVGSSIVKETPEGKVIDTAQATGPILAAVSSLHKRLKDLEGGKS